MRFAWRAFNPNMFASRSMAFFTSNTGNETGLIVAIGRRGRRFEICSVTLQTPRDDGPIEIRDPIAETGTVYPTQLSPVRNRELKELIPFPVQVCLPFASRSDHQSKSLGALGHVGSCTLHCRLEIPIVAFNHPEK